MLNFYIICIKLIINIKLNCNNKIMNNDNICFGIDFGTTNSCISFGMRIIQLL